MNKTTEDYFGEDVGIVADGHLYISICCDFDFKKVRIWDRFLSWIPSLYNLFTSFFICSIFRTMIPSTLKKKWIMKSLLLLGPLYNCSAQAQGSYDCESSFDIPHIMVSVLITESPLLSPEMLLPLFHSCDDFKPGATAGGDTIAAGKSYLFHTS